MGDSILRFYAKLISNVKEDKDRRFVISYRLCDDTIAIYEPHQKYFNFLLNRNSGNLAGKFLERLQLLKPSSIPYPSAVQAIGSTSTPDYYEAHDFYIGAEINVFSHIFGLIECDEFCLQYMEQNPKQFQYSDKEYIQKIAKNVCKEKIVLDGLLASLKSKDSDKSGFVDRKEFVECAKLTIKENLNKHVLINNKRR